MRPRISLCLSLALCGGASGCSDAPANTTATEATGTDTGQATTTGDAGQAQLYIIDYTD